MNRIKLAGLATVGALGLSLTGFVGAGTARADLASDLQTVVANAPAAIDVLIEQLQLNIDQFADDMSIDLLVNNIGGTLNLTGAALGAGTEQFGAIGLGLALATIGPYQVIAPYVIAFDNDPATILDPLNPDDIATILGNLPAAIDAALPQLQLLVADLLEGNLIAGTGLFDATAQPGVVGDAFAAYNAAAQALFAGTSFQDTAPLGLGIPLLVAAVVVASYIQQAEDGLAPVFEALAPVTAPIIDALNG